MPAHPVLRVLTRCVAPMALCLAVALAPAAAAPPVRGSSPTRGKVTARKGAATRSKARTARARPAPRTRRTVDAVAALPPLPAVDVPMLASPAELTGTGSGGGAGAAPFAAVAPSSSVSLGATEPRKPFAAFSRSATSLLEPLLERARSQIGTRYVLGAERPGGALDCSAFTRFAMEALGVRLPRTAAQQARVGTAVPRDRERLRPGDLLTFGSRTKVSHVGIYLGEGRFIHASVTSGQVIETTFAKNARLLRRWLGARRLLAGADSMAAGAASGG